MMITRLSHKQYCPQTVLKTKEKTETSVFFWCGRWDLNKSTHGIIGSICLILPSYVIAYMLVIFLIRNIMQASLRHPANRVSSKVSSRFPVEKVFHDLVLIGLSQFHFTFQEVSVCLRCRHCSTMSYNCFQQFDRHMLIQTYERMS